MGGHWTGTGRCMPVVDMRSLGYIARLTYEIATEVCIILGLGVDIISDISEMVCI